MQLNLIWDLDGTLIDSYKLIESSLIDTLNHFKIDFELEQLQDYIKDTSVSTYLKKQEELNNLEPLIMKNYFSQSLEKKNNNIELMPGARYVLESFNKRNINNYLFTNKGANTHNILNRFKLDNIFIEVVTSRDGFLKKPAPDAIEYLVDKYKLDKTNTYYIGDRDLDNRLARNSNIRSINLNTDSYNSIKIDKLSDLFEVLEIK